MIVCSNRKVDYIKYSSGVTWIMDVILKQIYAFPLKGYFLGYWSTCVVVGKLNV